jgi:hypothetical protein
MDAYRKEKGLPQINREAVKVEVNAGPEAAKISAMKKQVD